MEMNPPYVLVGSFCQTDQFSELFREWFNAQKHLEEIDGKHRTCRTANFCKTPGFKRAFYKWRSMRLHHYLNDVRDELGYIPESNEVIQWTLRTIERSEQKLGELK